MLVAMAGLPARVKARWRRAWQRSWARGVEQGTRFRPVPGSVLITRPPNDIIWRRSFEAVRYVRRPFLRTPSSLMVEPSCETRMSGISRHLLAH